MWCLHGDNKSCRCLHGPSHSPSNDGIYIRFLWPSLCRLPVCVYFFPIKVTLGCTARSKMLPRLCKKACMPSFSVSKPQDKINMLDEYIRGHDITLWYLLYRLETRMPQRVHNRTVFTNVDLYIGQALEKYKPYSTIMPDVSVTVFDFHKDTKRTAWVWNGSRNWNICYSVCILVMYTELNYFKFEQISFSWHS